MARFREQKNLIFQLCSCATWKHDLDSLLGAGLDRKHGCVVETAAAMNAKEAISPLMALLPRPQVRWQAAYGMGLAVSRLARSDMEQARVVIRRLMWSLNEESGNLGWGVPEAMGCILSLSQPLAQEYSRILISYGYETGGDDNFLDYAPLRAGVYWAIGFLAMNNPAAARPALVHLTAALHNTDVSTVAMAAFAHKVLANHVPPYGLDAPGRRDLWENAQETLERIALQYREAGDQAPIDYFDGEKIAFATPEELLAQAAAAAKELLRMNPDTSGIISGPGPLTE